MSEAFKSMERADAVNVFSGVGDFGESIVYKDANGVERTFVTNVFRVPPEAMQGAGPGRAKIMATLAVFVPLDPTGVNGLADQPDRGGVDSIYVAEIDGGTAGWFPVVSILFSYPGGWDVKLR